jgi:hypothetical protein
VGLDGEGRARNDGAEKGGREYKCVRPSDRKFGQAIRKQRIKGLVSRNRGDASMKPLSSIQQIPRGPGRVAIPEPQKGLVECELPPEIQWVPGKNPA